MARPKKEVDSDSIAINSKPLPKIKYYAKVLNRYFDVPVVDENGKQKVRMNNQGTPIYDAEGNAELITKQLKFETVSSRAKEGYLSVFTFDPNDTSAQNVAIGEVLESLALQRNTVDMTEDAYDQSTNAAMFAEKKRARELQEEVDALREENSKLRSREYLEKKLEELTGK